MYISSRLYGNCYFMNFQDTCGLDTDVGVYFIMCLKLLKYFLFFSYCLLSYRVFMELSCNRM